MVIITDTILKRYIDNNDLRILKKGNVKPYYGNGLYTPGTKGRDIYFNSNGDGFLDSLIGVGKTILSNIGLIKDAGSAIGEVAKGGSEIANLVKKSKKIHNMGKENASQNEVAAKLMGQGPKEGGGIKKICTCEDSDKENICETEELKAIKDAIVLLQKYGFHFV